MFCFRLESFGLSWGMIRSMVAVSLCFSVIAHCTEVTTYSQWMAASIISREQGIMTGKGGSSELLQAGIIQKAFARIVEQYADEPSSSTYAEYVTKSVESVSGFLGNATTNTGYPLDRFSNGNGLIQLSKASENVTITTALQGLRYSLDLQTRNPVGGLWYYVYPNWSYLDGMYSYAPFYSLYTNIFEPENGAGATKEIHYQLQLLWEHCRNESSGLLVHGYDYSKTAVWANQVTGASPYVWGRSLGWYAMALVDTLEVLPAGKHSDEWASIHCKTISVLSSIVDVVDPISGAWWQILDMPEAPGNYIESSASAMFVYALLRARHLGYLESAECSSKPELSDIVSSAALRAYDYIVNTFVVDNSNGTLSYNGTVSVCSLNSTATYEYYVNQPILFDSPLGTASFILASLEVERLHDVKRWNA